MSGAPRTARRRMACAVSAAPSSASHTSAPGRRVWSRTARRRPSQRRAGWGCVATDMRAAYSRPADRQRQSKCSRWMRRFGTPAARRSVWKLRSMPPRTAHEDRQPAAVAVGGGEDALGGEAPLDARVDQMGVQRPVAVGDRADLLGERRLAVGAVEEVDAMGQLVTVERAQPAQERRDADAAGDPHLPIGSLPMAEAPVGAADDGRHARLDELLQPRRVVAERLDRDAHDVLVRGARDRERMAVPAVLGLDVDHGELAGHELHVPADRAPSRSRPRPRRPRARSAPGSRAATGRSAPAARGRRRSPARRRRPPRSSSAGAVRRRTASRRARRARSPRRRRARWCGAALASARSRRRSGEPRAPPGRRARRPRGRAAAPAPPTASAAGSPTARARPCRSPRSPRAGLRARCRCGLAASRMCGASRTRPVMATRRCQTAARSIPSNHSSTQGSVLMSTRPIDSSRIDSAPSSCPM